MENKLITQSNELEQLKRMVTDDLTSPYSRVMYAKAEMMDAAAPTPIAAGQVELSASVSVQFELAQ